MVSQTSSSLDLIRTLRMSGYGLLILGPSQHLWFNFVAKVLPQRDVISTFKKIIMGQAIFGPCINSVFFSFNAALQGTQIFIWSFNISFFIKCLSGGCCHLVFQHLKTLESNTGRPPWRVYSHENILM